MPHSLKILEALTRKLEVNEFQMKSFFDLSIDIMCIANETHFTMVNPAWTLETGWPQKDMSERPWRSLLHPDDAKSTEAAHDSLRFKADLLRFINRYRCKDGSYKTLEWNARVTPSGHYYCVARVLPNGR